MAFPLPKLTGAETFFDLPPAQTPSAALADKATTIETLSEAETAKATATEQPTAAVTKPWAPAQTPAKAADRHIAEDQQRRGLQARRKPLQN